MKREKKARAEEENCSIKVGFDGVGPNPEMDLDRIVGFYAPQTWHPASNPSGRHRLRKLVILPTLLGPLVQEESSSSTTFFPVKNGEREREKDEDEDEV